MNDFIGFNSYKNYPSVDPFEIIQTALDLANKKPIQDLGEEFFKQVLKKKPPPDWVQQADDARHLFSGSLSFVQVVESLACWLMHPDAKLRPTLDKVCAVLRNHLPQEPLPPSLSPTEFSTLDKKAQEFFKLDTQDDVVDFLNNNPDFQTDPNIYTRRKDAKRKNKTYSLLDENKTPYYLILPRKSDDSNNGEFKAGRICYVIQKQDNQWKASRCFALTSKRTEGLDYYKALYPKEIALYNMTKGQDIFIPHRASFFFTDELKKHKRLGIYDCAVTTLFQSIHDRTCTLTMQQNLVKKVQKLHALKLVHCDIKPNNVLIGDQDEVYLCDLDSVLEEEAVRDYKGAVITSPHYLAKKFKNLDWFSRDRIALIRTLKDCSKKNKKINEDTSLDELAATLEKLGLADGNNCMIQ